jgi:DNA replication protein DnaC
LSGSGFVAGHAEESVLDAEAPLRKARLLPGKSLANFDFNAVPTISKAQVMALAAGDAWLDQGACCLIFGPPETDS